MCFCSLVSLSYLPRLLALLYLLNKFMVPMSCFIEKTRDTTTRVTSNVQFEQNATFLVSLMKQIPRVIVVFDGPGRSIEKCKTTMARYEKNMKDLDSLQEKINLLNGNDSRISKSKWNWLEKIEKRCLGLCLFRNDRKSKGSQEVCS